MTNSTMLVFHNPGSIDPRAFTTMGLHAKPDAENPIGHFGTGLKYSIATILREGGRIAILNAEHRFDFSRRIAHFRGEKYFKIMCTRREHNSSKKGYTFALPYTTELGKHWEDWMAYRELMSNCIDEDGDDPFLGDGLYFKDPTGERWFESGHTTILVDHAPFLEIFNNPERVQLHPDFEHETPIKLGKFDYYPNEPSNYVYCHGLRVHTLDSPSKGTIHINIPEVLTEDRTLKYASLLDYEFVREAALNADVSLLREIWGISSDYFEGALPWDLVPVGNHGMVVEALEGMPLDKDITSSRLKTWLSGYRRAIVTPNSAAKLIYRLDDLQEELEAVTSTAIQQWIHDAEDYLKTQSNMCEHQEPEEGNDNDDIPF